MHYVGDAVAFVVADSRAGAGRCRPDRDRLRRRGSRRRDRHGSRQSTPLVWPDLGTNRAFTYRLGDAAKSDKTFEKAAGVTRIEFYNNRLVCNYMEARAASANGAPTRTDSC